MTKSFFLSLSGSDKFRVDQNGKLFTRAELSSGVEYLVEVQVVDTKAEVFASSQIASAEIYLLAGTRPPQFYRQAYQAYLQEHLPPSMCVPPLDATLSLHPYPVRLFHILLKYWPNECIEL